MVSSVSGKDNQIVRCNWLPMRAIWCVIARSRLPTARKKVPRKPYAKLFIDKPCSVKMAVYWPSSFYHTRALPVKLYLLRVSIVFKDVKNFGSHVSCFLRQVSTQASPSTPTIAFNSLNGGQFVGLQKSCWNIIFYENESIISSIH